MPTMNATLAPAVDLHGNFFRREAEIEPPFTNIVPLELAGDVTAGEAMLIPRGQECFLRHHSLAWRLGL